MHHFQPNLLNKITRLPDPQLKLYDKIPHGTVISLCNAEKKMISQNIEIIGPNSFEIPKYDFKAESWLLTLFLS